MLSPTGERAIAEATLHGNALLKFISPNDVGITGSHQCGFYLPKQVWQMYSPHPPIKGQNNEHSVTIQWQDDRKTDSRVKWYGNGTRSEYRLTRFGKDFPFLASDTVGDLLVLIPRSIDDFAAYVLDLEEDIEETLAALGVQIIETWGVYQTSLPQLETPAACIDRRFCSFAERQTDFPSSTAFALETCQTLKQCETDFDKLLPDDALLRLIDAEYLLFRLVERQICQKDIVRPFKDVDDFIKTASSIMNRRKSRAGWSLENHVEYLLKHYGIPHNMRPDIDGEPDIVIPSKDAYDNELWPLDRLFVVGVKTTCKDRWRQVLNEARRVERKYILTLQQGISSKQLQQMHEANVVLVVPEKLHRHYPKDRQIEILTFRDFIERVRSVLKDG